MLFTKFFTHFFIKLTYVGIIIKVSITLNIYNIGAAFHKIIEEPAFKYHKLIYYEGRWFVHYSLPTGSGDNKVLVKEAGKFKVMR